MKLIVITKPSFFVEEDKIIIQLFEEGLDVLHLRKPDASPIYTERLLTLIPEKYHKRIVTHDHFLMKNEFKLKGIHLNERNPNPPAGYSGHISRSFECIEDLQTHKGEYSYMFLKYLYEQDAYGGQLTAFSAEDIRRAVKNKIIDTDVMAFGGITPENILEVKDFGFGGAVIMNDIWNKFEPCSATDYKAIISHFRKLKSMAD